MLLHKRSADMCKLADLEWCCKKRSNCRLFYINMHTSRFPLNGVESKKKTVVVVYLLVLGLGIGQRYPRSDKLCLCLDTLFLCTHDIYTFCIGAPFRYMRWLCAILITIQARIVTNIVKFKNRWQARCQPQPVHGLHGAGLLNLHTGLVPSASGAWCCHIGSWCMVCYVII